MRRLAIVLVSLVLGSAPGRTAETGRSPAGGGDQPPVSPGPPAVQPAPPPGSAGGLLEVTVSRAILMALENNRELAVERVRPEIVRTFEREEKGVFDPVLFADELGWQEIKGEKLRGGGTVEPYDTKSPVGTLGIESFLSSGTKIALDTSSTVVDETSVNQLVQSRIGLTVSQSLLRGLGPATNLARVRAARIDADVSAYELRGFAELLIADVERAYWDFARLLREVQILEESVSLADQLLKDTEERVRIGTLAQIELAAAKSELAFRRQDLLDARADAEKARLLLVRLLNPAGTDPWALDVRLQSPLVSADEAIGNVEDHVAVAHQKRPELNQARLLVARGDLDVVRTRNGLLPRMDIFVTMGRSGYAGSFGDAWRDRGSDHYDVAAGITFELPIRRRTGHARYDRAVLERGRADEVVANLRQLGDGDVRTAFVEADRAKAMIAAATATRELDEQKLEGEWDKHRIGRASTFQVARAQRDLTRSRRREAAALADERVALVELARLEGSLLDRRAIGVAGEEFIGKTVEDVDAEKRLP